MKSEIYLFAKKTDDGRLKLDINGPGREVMELLEEEAAKARVDDLVERRLTQDNILLQQWHEQAKAELED